MKRILVLTINDLKNVIREPMLLFILIGPLVMTLTMRWLLPILTVYTAPYVDLQIYYPVIIPFILLFSPMLLGMVTGFLLLDERDTQVFQTIIVTPLGKDGYLAYRSFLPLLLSFFYMLVSLPILGLVEVAFAQVVPIALLGALEAPVVGFFLAGFAGNKVEGLTLSKGLGLFMLLAALPYFVIAKWNIVAWLSPFYWPVQAFAAIGHPQQYWFYLGLGLLMHFALFFLLIIKVKTRFS